MPSGLLMPFPNTTLPRGSASCAISSIYSRSIRLCAPATLTTHAVSPSSVSVRYGQLTSSDIAAAQSSTCRKFHIWSQDEPVVMVSPLANARAH